MTRFNLITHASVVFLASFVGGLTGCTDKTIEATLFEDVTKGSGLDQYQGMTHGAYWGDVDNDGLPDVYLPNHLNKAQLFKNNGKGQFDDVTAKYLSAQTSGMGDKHGAAWADFNNDGRQDLVQLTGAGRGVGAEPKFLLENRGGKLVNVAKKLGVENVYGRTRMPLWFDYDQNGLLDLFHGAEERFDDRIPPMFFSQQKEAFHASQALAFASPTTPFCIVTSLNSEAIADVLCRMTGKGQTSQIFRLNKSSVVEKNLLPATGFNDVAAADFDNNGFIDLILARKNGPGPVAFGRPSKKEIIADILINEKNVEKTTGFTFVSSGEISVQVVSTFPKNALTPEHIYLGGKGNHPDKFDFALSADKVELNGVKASTPGSQIGVYIGKIKKDEWQVFVIAPEERIKKGKYQQISFKITSLQDITKLSPIGVELNDEKAPARLLMNYGDKLIKEGEKRGLHTRLVAGMNVVAADFDNDMDVDIYIIASGDIGSRESLLMLNRGNGYFDQVISAGGAKSGQTGVADSVTTVDFDGDGFLDLLTSSGGSMGRSLGLPSDGGGYHLYRNVGNSNHWLKIDLEGTKSNRDGVGAVVKLTTAGITQMRVQDGGTHNNGQNHKRLHFGLGKHSKVEKIQIYWPSGNRQEIKNIAVDQVLLIKEPII